MQFGVCLAKNRLEDFVFTEKNKHYFNSLTFPYMADTKLQFARYLLQWHAKCFQRLFHNRKVVCLKERPTIFNSNLYFDE